ncbi:MAG: large subunit ribosomal protein L3 [Acidimicrobiales bacterium]|jgi:large subunit ribosomal protein L3
MKFILGTKEGMTQVFDADGTCHAATILRVSPATITQVKTQEKDGYSAVQVATGSRRESLVPKAERGHTGGNFRHVKEFRTRVNYDESVDGLEKGQIVEASTFEAGDSIVVAAISKGKGFQGVVKRYNFKGNKATHGQKHTLRAPGSIGATGPARVFKGTRMAGRMGSDQTTVKNLRVLQVNAAENLLLVSGAVPGRKGTLVEVRNV